MVCGCIVFSLELLFKRENKGVQKAMGVCKVCKYSRHSYLNLSLISGLSIKGYNGGCIVFLSWVVVQERK